jgi:hypothetical protein
MLMIDAWMMPFLVPDVLVAETPLKLQVPKRRGCSPITTVKESPRRSFYSGE